MLPGARKPGYQAAFEQQMTLHDRDGAVEHALDHDDMASGAEDDEIGALCDEVHAAMAEAAEHETSEDWTPFESASEAYAAIVFNNPRFPMSRQHAQIALRFAKGSGARNVPSYTKVQASLARLRSLYDDLSGNKSKKWGALSALSYQFANLPAEQLCEERSILHFSISNDATALEMMDAFVKEIE
ncbi:unnamed protein product [Tilletia controversa]|nr:hypothetical protein CF335_g1015 [Tilletia laevis]CAD6901236.1 unnamed protein product [Tilletia controversa]